MKKIKHMNELDVYKDTNGWRYVTYNRETDSYDRSEELSIFNLPITYVLAILVGAHKRLSF